MSGPNTERFYNRDDDTNQFPSVKNNIDLGKIFAGMAKSGKLDNGLLKKFLEEEVETSNFIKFADNPQSVRLLLDDKFQALSPQEQKKVADYGMTLFGDMGFHAREGSSFVSARDGTIETSGWVKHTDYLNKYRIVIDYGGDINKALRSTLDSYKKTMELLGQRPAWDRNHPEIRDPFKEKFEFLGEAIKHTGQVIEPSLAKEALSAAKALYGMKDEDKVVLINKDYVEYRDGKNKLEYQAVYNQKENILLILETAAEQKSQCVNPKTPSEICEPGFQIPGPPVGPRK